ITAHGRALSRLPLHPRLAHMLATAGPDAAPMAALLADRDPLNGAPSDLTLRLEALRDPRRFTDTRPYGLNRPALSRIQTEASRLSKAARTVSQTLSPAQTAALAYPDRIGLRRKGDAPRYQLSGGKGAVLNDSDTLAGARLIVATDLDGNPREARIRQAIQISEPELRDLFADRITWENICLWSKRDRRVTARQQEKLGAIALDDRIWKDAPPEALSRAMLDGVRDLGLTLSDPARRFVARVDIARSAGHDLPDMSNEALMERLDYWLLPYLSGVTTADHWKRFDLLPALRAQLDWDATQILERAVPGSFTTPLGRQIPIDYSGEAPEISLRLQEMFGQTTHPTVGKTPLRVTLLSPAGRPVQTTLDIPGFWDSSYADVRKDMRGRYPRHPWPENPREADPTLRVKPRGT
ncbi:MAG: ATP-dependent helicase C-terminal domain-containing protein, partial [Rhodobacterales bacterium]